MDPDGPWTCGSGSPTLNCELTIIVTRVTREDFNGEATQYITQYPKSHIEIPNLAHAVDLPDLDVQAHEVLQHVWADGSRSTTGPGQQDMRKKVIYKKNYETIDLEMKLGRLKTHTGIIVNKTINRQRFNILEHYYLPVPPRSRKITDRANKDPAP